MDFFFFQAEDGIRDVAVTGVQTCALPISRGEPRTPRAPEDRAAPRASTGVLISGLSGQPRSRVEAARGRSEEHTSELQSRLHLVCRLLLEKKKKKTQVATYTIIPRTRGNT